MDAGLKRELEEKVRSGERLTREDGIASTSRTTWPGSVASPTRCARARTVTSSTSTSTGTST